MQSAASFDASMLESPPTAVAGYTIASVEEGGKDDTGGGDDDKDDGTETTGAGALQPTIMAVAVSVAVMVMGKNRF